MSETISAEIKLKDFISSELDKISKKVEEVGKKSAESSQAGSKGFEGFGQAVNKLKPLLAGLAIGKLASDFKNMVFNVAEANDAIIKSSRVVGVAVEDLSAWQHVIQLGGGSAQDMTTALRVLSKNMADTADGTGMAKDAFAKLRIDVKKADGSLKDADDILFEVSNRFKDLPDGMQKASLAQEIFGRSGTAMINTLNNGSDALREQLNEAEQLGVVISEDMGRSAEEFNDSLLRMNQSFQGVKNEISTGAMPVFTEFFNQVTAGEFSIFNLSDSSEDLSKVVTDKLGKAFFTIRPVIKGLTNTLSFMWTTIEGGVKSIFSMGEALFHFAKGDFQKGIDLILETTNEANDEIGKSFQENFLTEDILADNEAKYLAFQQRLTDTAVESEKERSRKTFELRDIAQEDQARKESERIQKEEEKRLKLALKAEQKRIKEEEKLKKEQLKKEQEMIELSIKLEKEKSEALSNSYSQASSALASLFQENKAIAIADATLQAYLAIQKTLASVPFPANIIASGAIGATAFGNVAKMSGIKFEKGGFVTGSRHSFGGVPAELEGGEFVLSRQDVSNLGGAQGVQNLRTESKQNFAFNNTFNVAVSGDSGDVVNGLRKEVSQFARFFREEVVGANFNVGVN